MTVKVSDIKSYKEMRRVKFGSFSMNVEVLENLKKGETIQEIANRYQIGLGTTRNIKNRQLRKLGMLLNQQCEMLTNKGKQCANVACFEKEGAHYCGVHYKE